MASHRDSQTSLARFVLFVLLKAARFTCGPEGAFISEFFISEYNIHEFEPTSTNKLTVLEVTTRAFK